MAQSYRFGAVEIRPAERQILVEGKPASVGARAFDLLLTLIERRDRVVTKDELFELVWPGLVVEENNLHVQVSTLRKILGPRAVATIPGRGFRFTLPVDSEQAPSCALPSASRHNLPAQLNSFIGREREVAEVCKLLESARLVTLTGAGGTGKTRLSLNVAAEVLARYPDGVWFVELAPIADGERVAQAVASTLGVKEDAGRPVAEALARYVKDRKLLVVLDNCEQVLLGCAELAMELLNAGPNAAVLASSREPLRTRGETIYAVPALEVPEPDPPASPEALSRYPAARLFVDRAVAAHPGFRVTEANATAVAQICRRLDGIPLALELAAARVRAISVDQIARHLADCFRVLSGGDPTALPRQQTLRASIDWSYDLLEMPERILLRRLAVFSGGWTFDAAQAVGAGGDVSEDDLFDLLVALVDKSLVSLDPVAERYRLLETVRQYALELLESSGEAPATRARHLAFFLDFAEKARPELSGPHQGEWLARLDADHANVLAAHSSCDGADGGAELGLRLASALRPYWLTRGQAGLGAKVFGEALARRGAQQRDRPRCRALADAGQIAYFMGRYAEAQRYLEESVAIARELHDTRRIAAALQPLGLACVGLGDLKTARRHLEEALALARELGDQREIAAAINQVAQLKRVEGDLDSAAPLFDQMLAIAREIGDQQTIAIGLLNMAMTAAGRGDLGRARTMATEAHTIVDEVGLTRIGVSVLEVCAGLAAAGEDWRCAARFFGAAEQQMERAGMRRSLVDDAYLAPLVAKARKALGAEGFTPAEREGRALSYEASMQDAADWLHRA